jgi:hypothetical protein
MDVDSAGNASLDLTKTYHRHLDALTAAGVENWSGVSMMDDIEPPVILDLIKLGRVKLEERRAAEKAKQEADAVARETEREKWIARFLLDPDARGDDNGYVYYISPLDQEPRIAHSRSGYSIQVGNSPNAAAVMQEIRRRNQFDRDAQAEKEAKVEAEKQLVFDKWIETQDSLIRKQYEAGLLNRKWILKHMADEAFDAYAVPDEYEPHFCDDSYCSCGSKDVETVPPSIYRGWLEIEGGLPEGTKVQFRRVRECNDTEEALPAVYAAYIQMPVGTLTFDRLIRLQKVQVAEAQNSLC